MSHNETTENEDQREKWNTFLNIARRLDSGFMKPRFTEPLKESDYTLNPELENMDGQRDLAGWEKELEKAGILSWRPEHWPENLSEAAKTAGSSSDGSHSGELSRQVFAAMSFKDPEVNLNRTFSCDEMPERPLMTRECVAGVSGGPDSMALLSMLCFFGWRPVVCHVNYAKRKSADRDEKIVREFCETRGLEMRTLRPVYTAAAGNFQGWAREVRMDFFEKAARETGNVPIFLAHHQDDVLETYILQKKRNILCDFFGIQKITVKNDLRYIRPLLKLSKEDLQAYNEAFGIEWGLDESNLSDTYLRNQIRHHELSGLDQKGKTVLEQIRKLDNEALNERRQRAREAWNCLPASSWLDDEDAPFIVDDLYSQYAGTHLSASFCQEIVRQLKKSGQVPVHEHVFELSEGELHVFDQKELQPPALCIEDREELETILDLCENWDMDLYQAVYHCKSEKHRRVPAMRTASVMQQKLHDLDASEYDLDPVTAENLKKIREYIQVRANEGLPFYDLLSNGEVIEGIHVADDDFPLTIAPAKPGDVIVLRYGRKKVSRIYLDQKTPHFKRKTRLIVKNRANEVIFVPQTGCDKSHFSPKPTFYMVEF